MSAQQLVAAALLCSIASRAFAYDVLGDWPTKTKTDGAYEYAVEGLYQYDLNNFFSNAIYPISGEPLFSDANTWRRRELDAHIKAPNGFELDVGYDWSASWTVNYLKFNSTNAGAFRLGQFKTPVRWEASEMVQSTVASNTTGPWVQTGTLANT